MLTLNVKIPQYPLRDLDKLLPEFEDMIRLAKLLNVRVCSEWKGFSVSAWPDSVPEYMLGTIKTDIETEQKMRQELRRITPILRD